MSFLMQSQFGVSVTKLFVKALNTDPSCMLKSWVNSKQEV